MPISQRDRLYRAGGGLGNTTAVTVAGTGTQGTWEMKGSVNVDNNVLECAG